LELGTALWPLPAVTPGWAGADVLGAAVVIAALARAHAVRALWAGVLRA
jgi:hypothetical protein